MGLSRRRLGLSVALAGLTLVLALPASAGAAHPLKTGLTGVKSRSEAEAAARANAHLARIGVSWAGAAPHKPSNPRNPNDPAYDWSSTDASIAGARAKGLTVMLSATRAPRWAEGKGRHRAKFPGTWKPDPQAFGKFAHALAARYAGKGHPRVRFFDVWNEPNLTQYLAPQWKHHHGKVTPKSPKRFALMANQFYEGVKSVHKGNKVIAPSTSPYGDPRKGPYPYTPRMRPVYFLRHALCLKRKHGKLRPKRKHCERLKFDIAAHHPLDRAKGHGPTYHALNRDDAGPGDMGKIKRNVRAAERFGTVRPSHKHRPLWVTEFWRSSKPPDPAGIPLGRQARWIEKALYVFWKDGVHAAIYQSLVDPGGAPSTSNIKSGLLFEDRTKKPAYRAFRFPFVTHRKSPGKVGAWGKAPASGKIKIQVRKHGGWKTRKKKRVKNDAIFRVNVRLHGKAKLRAKLGKETSLTWRQGK